MPLPTSINDLSTTAGSNSPAGSENPQTFDDYLRVYASYIAALRDVVLSGTANLSTANLAYTGTLTGSTGVVNIGSGQVYKDASGNLGLGMTAPTELGAGYVNVQAAGSSGSIFQAQNTAGTVKAALVADPSAVRVGSRTAHPLLITMNSNEVARWDTSGNLGLGTASPASILHASSASAAANIIATTGNASFRLGDSVAGATRKEFTITLDNTNNRVDIQAIQQGVASRDISLNASGGNVGIGTVPASGKKLHVAGEFRLDATTSTTATAGANGDVPAQVVGYLTINIAGTDRKIPFYA